MGGPERSGAQHVLARRDRLGVRGRRVRVTAFGFEELCGEQRAPGAFRCVLGQRISTFTDAGSETSPNPNSSRGSDCER